MSRQSKNARNRVIAKQYSEARKAGKRSTSSNQSKHGKKIILSGVDKFGKQRFLDRKTGLAITRDKKTSNIVETWEVVSK